MNQVLFTEQQYMRQWWLQVVLAVPVILFIWAFVQQMIMGYPFGDKPMSDFGLLLMGALVLGLSGLLWAANLKTEFLQKGLRYRFFPFHIKTKELPWSEVKKVSLVKYNPIRDYGGWGLRYSFKNGKAFNVQGNLGIRVELKEGKNILFGTQDPEAIKGVFVKLKVPFKNELSSS
jgi:hypothetical protein